MEWLQQIANATPTAMAGRVSRIDGLVLAVRDFPAPIGALVEHPHPQNPPLCGEVVGFRGNETVIFPFGSIQGVQRGDLVRLVASTQTIRVGHDLLGCVVDAHGKVLNRTEPPYLPDRIGLMDTAPLATERPRIENPFTTGIRAIDGLMSCGRGQRLGIFAGSGVGKSVLLGMLARKSSADVNVIALIGERGREVNEFIERDLGDNGASKSVVVVATGDEPAVLRVKAAFAATAIAEYFCQQGQHVLLMMDSVTRFCMAQREVGLANREPPATRGYPPSVFAILPQLLERAGNYSCGSITGFYSVLAESDDPNEPIRHAARSALDGHIELSNELAARGHYPAIDVLPSVSRLMTDIASDSHIKAARQIRQTMAVYHEHRDLISVGAYRQGSIPQVDVAIKMKPALDEFLRQELNAPSSWNETLKKLEQLVAKIDSHSLDETPNP